MKLKTHICRLQSANIKEIIYSNQKGEFMAKKIFYNEKLNTYHERNFRVYMNGGWSSPRFYFFKNKGNFGQFKEAGKEVILDIIKKRLNALNNSK
jgi:hypothetical protein